jgi:lipopolysaccharide export system permease protein
LILDAPEHPPGTASGLRSTLAVFIKGDFARGFFRQVAGQSFAVIVLIEAIFLAEHFTWVFRDAVRHEAALFGIWLILACTSTEIFDLALAIGVLIAGYAALLRMRESRELLVLFASGLGPLQLSALIGIVAVAAQFVGLVGNGVVDPLSRYAQRSILFSSELHSLKKGVAGGEFYYFPSYVAYAMDHPPADAAPPPAPRIAGVAPSNVIDARPPASKSVPAPGRDRTLFVYQQIAPHTSRVVTAAQARLDGPDPTGKIVLNLNDFTSHTFADAHPLGGPDSSPALAKHADMLNELKTVPRVTMKVRDMSQLMMVNQLLPFGSRGSSEGVEQTIFEQLAAVGPPDLRGAQMRLLAERFSRSLLALLAPLFALAAVSLTTRLTNWLALPAACLLLMSVNLGCEWVITTVAPLHVYSALFPPLLLCAVLAALAYGVVLGRHGELVRPQLARS